MGAIFQLLGRHARRRHILRMFNAHRYIYCGVGALSKSGTTTDGYTATHANSTTDNDNTTYDGILVQRSGWRQPDQHWRIAAHSRLSRNERKLVESDSSGPCDHQLSTKWSLDF